MRTVRYEEQDSEELIGFIKGKDKAKEYLEINKRINKITEDDFYYLYCVPVEEKITIPAKLIFLVSFTAYHRNNAVEFDETGFIEYFGCQDPSDQYVSVPICEHIPGTNQYRYEVKFIMNTKDIIDRKTILDIARRKITETFKV